MNSAQRKLTWFGYFIEVLNKELESNGIPRIYGPPNYLIRLFYLVCCESCVYSDSLIVLDELIINHPKDSRYGLFMLGNNGSFGGDIYDYYDIIPGWTYTHDGYIRERDWGGEEVGLIRESPISPLIRDSVKGLIENLGGTINDASHINKLRNILSENLAKCEYNKQAVRSSVFKMWKYLITG